MQQEAGGGGGGGPTQSQFGVPVPPADMTPPATAALTTHMLLAGTDQTQLQQLVEEASPISSRPPATAAGTLDEFIRLSGTGTGGLPDEDEADRAGGVTSGNRWPRQETLALLQIRSHMDAAFRDATVKGPLWEDVSRKLSELGYKRSAQKCKEKFENVNKYYKRTKEGRAGRQDGKSYRFFSQLEALHNTGTATTSFNVVVSSSQPTATATTLDVSPVSIGIPMPVSSVRLPPSTIGMSSSSSMFTPDLTATMAPAAVSAPPRPPAGISFSSTSNGSSSSASSQEDDEDEPSYTAAGSSRKRKRQSSVVGATRRMMEFFEGLMKHVMQKQEAMQQRFLEAIEKREHDRMIREEAWKRQEMARLTREHELMAQERSISASRDAAIIAFLQKITGQTIQLPPPVIVPTVPQPPPPPPPQPHPMPLAPVVTVSTQQPPKPQPALVVSPQQQNEQDQEQKQQHQQVHHHHQTSISTEVAMALVPEQEVPQQEISSIGSLEPTSTRWPKAEVLALIKLRSGLESKYQEVGPKGPLWEEISAGMQRMGYKRSAKRCKEKWENINKYFKKVKESNKKRPEDAKTCPYFHELDALYRKKILGSSSGFVNQNMPEELQQQQKESTTCTSDPLPPAKPDSTDDVSVSELQSKNGGGADNNTGLPGSLFGEGNGRAGAGAAKKPEDIVKEFIKLQGTQKRQQQQQQQQQLMVHDYGKIDEGDDSEEDDVDEDGDNDDDEEEEEEDVDDDDDDELEEERKMAYKIEFQRQSTSASNGGGSGAPSFLAIVQ